MSIPIVPEKIYDLEVNRPPHLGGGKWRLEKLTPIMVIFGRNGSGKSILLRNIRDQNKALNHYCIPERSGDISFNPGAIYEQLEAQARSNKATQNYSPEYRRDIITRIGAYLQKRGAMRKMSTDDDLGLIEYQINSLGTDFRFEIKSANPPFSLTRISTGEAINNTLQLSSGEAQHFTLALDVLLICNMWKLDGQTGMLLLDEPDPHSHPDMQQRFAKFLVDLHKAYGCRIIIATHSTIMLSALGYHGLDLTSVIYLDKKATHQAKGFTEVLKKMSSCLGGHALMGPLFDFPILLVEGDDDYRIWSEIPRHHNAKVSVIPCNGDEIFEYQRTLEKIFNSIMDGMQSPRGYTILDGDKSLPSGEQKHIKYLRLNCRESENLYLTDEILKSMGWDWKSACEKVMKESHKYLTKASALNAIESWDRRNADCKSLIIELSDILDPKNLNWAYRLGKELGKNTPTGQLADFLGVDLMEAIWKPQVAAVAQNPST
jgi:predicted ATPase